jgi:hypothetical protein
MELPTSKSAPDKSAPDFNLRLFHPPGKRNFLSLLCLVLLGFAAANLAMLRWAAHLNSTRRLDAIDRTRGANVAILGNSLMEDVFDPEPFELAARRASARLVPVLAALAYTFPAEHYLLFKRALRNSSIHTVVLGFFDYQLSMVNDSKAPDLFNVQTLPYDSRIPIREADYVYEFSLTGRLRFRIFRALPLLGYRSAGWAAVQSLRNRLGDSNWDPENGFRDGFNVEAEMSSRAPVRFNHPTESIVAESNALGARVIFVLMPISPRHASEFYTQPRWQAYLRSLRTIMEHDRCGFIDASNWFPSQSDFADSVHLHLRLREDFSAALARAVVAERAAMQSKWPGPVPR